MALLFHPLWKLHIDILRLFDFFLGTLSTELFDSTDEIDVSNNDEERHSGHTAYKSTLAFHLRNRSQKPGPPYNNPYGTYGTF